MLVDEAPVPEVQFYQRSDYIVTDTGNKVSRKAKVIGSQNIILGGKTLILDAVIRGDLRRISSRNAVVVAIGKYCIINGILKPPYKIYKSVFSYYPTKIGDHVHIEKDCIIEAASIGSHVKIGAGSIIGRFAILKDCCMVLPDSVLAPNCVVAPFSIMGGNPARFVGELPESFPEVIEEYTTDFYHKRFLPAP